MRPLENLLYWQHSMQWRRKLENFEGDVDEKFGVSLGGYSQSKTHRFWPICLDNFATFNEFYFLFFSVLYCFSSSLEF